MQHCDECRELNLKVDRLNDHIVTLINENEHTTKNIEDNAESIKNLADVVATLSTAQTEDRAWFQGFAKAMALVGTIGASLAAAAWAVISKVVI